MIAFKLMDFEGGCDLWSSGLIVDACASLILKTWSSHLFSFFSPFSLLSLLLKKKIVLLVLSVCWGYRMRKGGSCVQTWNENG